MPVPILGLEPRVFRLEGGRAIQLRHTGKYCQLRDSNSRIRRYHGLNVTP